MANFSKLGYHIVEKKSKISAERLKKISKELNTYGIKTPVEELLFETVDNSDFPLDCGFNSYDELISHLADYTCGEEIELLREFHKSLCENGIPKPPDTAQIKMYDGWSKYDYDGNFIERIKAPKDKILVFDTETYVKGKNLPIIGTATGVQFSYIWIAKEFVNYTPEDEWDQYSLVPLPNTKIVIAHNAGFDVCRIRESYTLPVQIKALDTLSMHVITNGLCSQQRYASVLEQKDPSELTWREKSILKNPPKWLQRGTTNSLVAVYNFHVAKDKEYWSGESHKLNEVDKEIREVFVVTNTMDDFVSMGQFREKLLEYASLDTFYTTEIFKSLYPKYLESKPHRAALSGHLLLTTARVPLVDNWEEWIENCENLLESSNKEASDIIKEACLELYKNWSNGTLTTEEIEKDPFLSQLKWNIKRKKIGKDYNSLLYNKLRELEKKSDISLQDIPPVLREYYLENTKNFFNKNFDYIPLWFEFIFKNPNVVITPKTEISHLILRLHYEGYPVFKHKTKGWGYFVDGDRFEKVKSYGVPGKNIGNILSRDYLDDIKNGVLTGEHPAARQIFDIAIRTSFWISTRSRVLERFIVNSKTPNGTPFKMMCPQPIPHGTISGRSTENLFLVMTSPKKEKIGSEIRSRITAPKNYNIVSADFSAQELVVAALYSDRVNNGEIGSSPISFRTMLGNKEKFTDIHSSTSFQLFLQPRGYEFIDGTWYIHEKD